MRQRLRQGARRPTTGQLTEQDMLGIAAGVGYSETAFITEVLPDRRPSARQAPDFQGRSYWMICPAVDTQPAQMSAAQNRQGGSRALWNADSAA